MKKKPTAPRKSQPSGRRGQVVVVAVMLLLVALIMIPALVLQTQRESKWSVKQSHSNTAYHLAEAGQDRGLWHLSFSTGIWSMALNGDTLENYAFDKEFDDVSGGVYKISITSGPGTADVTLISQGKEARNGEVRTIKAVYTGNVQMSGFVVEGTVDYQDSFTVYWGQVTSYTGITQSADPPYYPKKVSGGQITPWDTVDDGNNSDPVKNYEAYVDMGDYPVVDFNYYRNKAKLTRAPDPAAFGGDNCGQTAPYAGTGYFDGPGDCEVMFSDYTFDCSTCVFFVETNKAKIDKTGYLHLEALLIYNENIHIHNDGFNGYSVSVPTDAWEQYIGGTIVAYHTPDSAAPNEYPGDGGLNMVQPTYTIPTVAFDGPTNTGMSFHGFLYSNSFNCNGGDNSNVGQFLIGPGGTSISTMIIYFDPQVAQNVHYERTPIVRMSWQELVRPWS